MPFASLAAGFLPVLLFLAGLRIMDSYKLVPRRALLESLVAGALAAGVAYILNRLLLELAHVEPHVLGRALAPLIEESLKATYVAWLIRTGQVGFMVDAAISGFAIGAGFGLIENLYYAGALHDLSLPLWLARGLGTAVMHGCTTAMFALVTQSLSERRGRTSERATRAWLGTGLDGEVEALEQLLEGEVAGTRVGHYLEALRTRFPGAVVADMLCLLRIHLELSIRAKGMLIARSAGVDIQPDASVRANLEELRYLERTIGPTGKLAMLPLRRTSSRDLWQIMLLSRRAESRSEPRSSGS